MRRSEKPTLPLDSELLSGKGRDGADAVRLAEAVAAIGGEVRFHAGGIEITYPEDKRDELNQILVSMPFVAGDL